MKAKSIIDSRAGSTAACTYWRNIATSAFIFLTVQVLIGAME